MGMFDDMSTQELTGRNWEFEEFQEYFKKEGKKWGNSPQFKAIVSAMNDYRQLRAEKITPESAVKMVNANDALMKACSAYTEHKAKQQKNLSASENRRVLMASLLWKFQDKMNFSEVRDIKNVRALEGKTWEGAMPFTVKQAEIQISGKAAGANVSQRFLIETGGRKGFFTARNELKYGMNPNYYYNQLLSREQDPKTRELLKKCKGMYDTMTDDERSMPKSGILEKDQAKMRLEYEYSINLKLDGLPIGDPKRESLKLLLRGDTKSILPYYYQRLAEGNVAMEERGAILEEAIKRAEGARHVTDGTVKMSQYLRQNRDLREALFSIPVPQMDMRLSDYQQMWVKKEILSKKRELQEKEDQLYAGTGEAKDKSKEERDKEIKENRELVGAMDALIADNRLLHGFIKAMADKTADKTGALAGNFDYEGKTVELTSRNIATTRIAELIGAGDSVARSEKMEVISDGKKITGCFMEFAKGVDPSSKDPEAVKKMSQVEFSPNPSFNRSMMSMEILDFLCAQGDRHGYNMFYQLSEPDEHGKRNVIGLQGIDNDLAFGDCDKDTARQGDLEQTVIFIDRDMAAKIRNLKHEDLDYALSDVLTEHQLKLTKDRLDQLQAHLEKGMVEVGPDEWDLNKYDMNTPEDQLDEQGKRYVKGLKSLDEAYKKPSLIHHKHLYVKDSMDGGREEFERQEEKAQRIAEGLTAMFGEAEEPERKTDQKQAEEPKKETVQKEAEEPKKETAQKQTEEPKKETAQKEAPPLPSRRRGSFQDLQKQAAEEKTAKENKAPEKDSPERKAPLIGRSRNVPGGSKPAPEKKEDTPQRVRTNFLGMSGRNAPQRRTPINLGNQEKQAERQKESGGRAMG